MSDLQIRDPFQVQNSEQVVETLKADQFGNHGILVLMFRTSFYSLPHDNLLDSVKTCIEDNHELSFQNSSGVPTECFLEL